MSEQIGLIAGFVLTLMVFSYLLGDNILYRLALAVFVGLSAGYLTLVTLDTVLIPWANQTLLNSAAGLGLPVIGVIPFGLALLLLLKGVPRYGRLGNAALAFLIGVGTAVGRGWDAYLLSISGPPDEQRWHAADAARAGVGFRRSTGGGHHAGGDLRRGDPDQPDDFQRPAAVCAFADRGGAGLDE